jgi:hypothetical protein
MGVEGFSDSQSAPIEHFQAEAVLDGCGSLAWDSELHTTQDPAQRLQEGPGRSGRGPFHYGRVYITVQQTRGKVDAIENTAKFSNTVPALDSTLFADCHDSLQTTFLFARTQLGRPQTLPDFI